MSTNGNPTETTNRNIYFSRINLEKLDRVRGLVKRSTLINTMIESFGDEQLKELMK